jgi:hypothetical protein
VKNVLIVLLMRRIVIVIFSCMCIVLIMEFIIHDIACANMNIPEENYQITNVIEEYKKTIGENPSDSAAFFTMNRQFEELFDRFQNDFRPKSNEQIMAFFSGMKDVEKQYGICFKKEQYLFYTELLIIILSCIGLDALISYCMYRKRKK